MMCVHSCYAIKPNLANFYKLEYALSECGIGGGGGGGGGGEGTGGALYN